MHTAYFHYEYVHTFVSVNKCCNKHTVNNSFYYKIIIRIISITTKIINFSCQQICIQRGFILKFYNDFILIIVVYES